jgi:hypothetical protein
LQLPTDVDGEILQAFIVSPIQPRRQHFAKTLALKYIKNTLNKKYIKYYETCKHSPSIDQGSFTAEKCDRTSLGATKKEKSTL